MFKLQPSTDLHELRPGHVVFRQERELAEEGRLAAEVVLERVGRAVHGSQACHDRAHEHDAARFRPQRSVALVPQVLHDQVHLGLVVVVEARVEHYVVLVQDISNESISIEPICMNQHTRLHNWYHSCCL